jgi:hypothetical protein
MILYRWSTRLLYGSQIGLPTFSIAKWVEKFLIRLTLAIGSQLLKRLRGLIYLSRDALKTVHLNYILPEVGYLCQE